ncbi:MAG: DUF4041 domain-containing protein [Coriobacteriales bacterium]|nr:DUF4041 domain-containing protein [Coriobacteriales bacterium]
MGLFDGKRKLEDENRALRNQIDQIYSSLSPLQQEGVDLSKKIEELKIDCKNLEAYLSSLKNQSLEKEKEVLQLNRQINELGDDAIAVEFGLYTPKFDFQSVDEFKANLKVCRDKQKEIIKGANSLVGSSSWTVNGSKREGVKMVKDFQKAIFTAFNLECDEYVRKVRGTNISKTIEMIDKKASQINKLGRVLNISIPYEYVLLKQDEARISYEYALFKEQEKENARILREQEREAKLLGKEIAEKRKKLDKEIKQYANALVDVEELMLKDNGNNSELLLKKKELESKLADAKKAKEDVDYREANQKAGYVYIISNIGSFGENVYKIGMTRRLDPMDRVRELGDASVPFNFDVHAMIFADDAPALEAALHREFDSFKLNKVNTRREFFNVSLEDVKRVVKENYDKTVEFFDEPDAEQYRISLKMD